MSAVLEQRTEAWHATRLGKATASKIADIMARTRSGYGASRKNYAAQLVAERLTGMPGDGYTNAAMQWGIDHEADARAAYELARGVVVVEVGFVDHPRIAMTGASPDGRVGSDGLVEIKCPNTATHIETLLGAPVEDKYLKQMMWQMACDGRAWCEFVSYDPRLPERMQLHIRRVERDDKLIAAMEEEVVNFLAEVGETVLKLLDAYAENTGGW